MHKHADGGSPRVLREVVTSLPGRHRRTSQAPPERETPSGGRVVETGADNPAALTSAGHRLIGALFWVGWFSWGVYTWWFMDRSLRDFVVGVVVWSAAFVFSVVGIPLVRQAAMGQQRR
ncbi:MAG: hypothetical protein F2621_03715 [Actinobacteria bacterium]|jgi:hypothetical protein|uniref:Unannotated protein n=1 Tax=freshwater metagenome TaxID=449393 RepID=A0A6J6EB47_9ZZZZ|nr:hypothetical protein [Actinomycetota bacterium]MTA33067.1 hypothetical protein [Actinomycetota bacterium]